MVKIGVIQSLKKLGMFIGNHIELYYMYIYLIL